MAKTENFYDEKYKIDVDPWNYSKKAVEIIRHEYILQLALSLKSKYKRILDVGCAKGNVITLFNGFADEIYGIDISETAVEKTKNSLSALNSNSTSKFFFNKENILTSSYKNDFFDLILLSDGINEWFGETENRGKALQEAFRILAPNGFVVISDYQKPGKFDDYINVINNSPFKIVKIIYFYDRFCYQFYSWFKALENYTVVSKINKSKLLAKALMRISKLFGKKGAKHLFVIATK